MKVRRRRTTEEKPVFTKEQRAAIKLIAAQEINRVELSKKRKRRSKKQVMTGRGFGVIEQLQKAREEKERLALAGTE